MLKIVTLCGFGMGTSLMMKMACDDILNELGVKAQVYPWDLMSFKGGEPVDIIICGDDMEPHLKDVEATVLLLRDITNNDEMRQKLIPILREKGVLPMENK
ncbi:MAG: PTS sugar transporter subunit IIB [Pelolinea sp.]|nr:PTS sugar transporter subunit IIB [Pelolinea sp.]